MLEREKGLAYSRDSVWSKYFFNSMLLLNILTKIENKFCNETAHYVSCTVCIILEKNIFKFTVWLLQLIHVTRSKPPCIIETNNNYSNFSCLRQSVFGGRRGAPGPLPLLSALLCFGGSISGVLKDDNMRCFLKEMARIDR